jgi:release factor glutamine methyltransferase
MTTIRSLTRSGDVLRRWWRQWLHWRYRLFQRRRHDHLVLEEVAGLPILVLPGVFNPKLFWTGELMARTLDGDLVPAGTAVLDMGTGSGIGAVAAARWAGRVVAVDINPAAVRCARINLILNGVEDRVEVHEGDLFGPVQGDRFDVVLFNPPYLPGTPATPLDRAFRGPGVARRFALGLGQHLAPGGHALLALSSVGDGPGYAAELDGAGFALEVVAERRLIGETLVVYRVSERS